MMENYSHSILWASDAPIAENGQSDMRPSESVHHGGKAKKYDRHER